MSDPPSEQKLTGVKSVGELKPVDVKPEVGQQLSIQGQQQETQRTTQVPWGKVIEQKTSPTGPFLRATEGGVEAIGESKKVSERALKAAREAIVLVLNNPQLLKESEEFSFIAEAIEAIGQFKIASLDLTKVEDQARLAQAVNILFENNPSQAITLGLFTLKKIVGSVGETFDITLIEETQQQGKKGRKKENSLPELNEILSNLGFGELFFEVTRDSQGKLSLAFKIPQEIGTEEEFIEFYNRRYNEELEKVKKGVKGWRSWGIILSVWDARTGPARKELESKKLKRFTDEELRAIFQKAHEGVLIGRFNLSLKNKPQQAGNTSQPIIFELLHLKDQQEAENLLKLGDEASRKRAIEIMQFVYGLMDDFIAVDDEIRRVTGAPAVIGDLKNLNEILSRSKDWSLIDNNTDNIVQSISSEARERLALAKAKEQVGDFAKIIEDQISRLKKTASESTKEGEESDVQNALQLARDLTKLQTDVSVKKEEAIKALGETVQNIPSELAGLFNDDSTSNTELILRLIRGEESVFSIFGKDKISSYLRTESNQGNTLGGRIENLQQEYKILNNRLKEASEYVTVEGDEKGKKVSRPKYSDTYIARLNQQIEKIEEEIRSFQEITRNPLKLRQYIIGQLGISLDQLPAAIRFYLDSSRSFDEKTIQLKSAITLINQERDEKNQITFSGNLGELIGKLEGSSPQDTRDKLKQLQALKMIFSTSGSEPDVLADIYQRFKEAKDRVERGEKLAPRTEIWGRLVNEGFQENNQQKEKIIQKRMIALYVLFGKERLNGLNLTPEQIDQISGLILGMGIGGNTDINNLIPQFLSRCQELLGIRVFELDKSLFE